MLIGLVEERVNRVSGKAVPLPQELDVKRAWIRLWKKLGMVSFDK